MEAWSYSVYRLFYGALFYTFEPSFLSVGEGNGSPLQCSCLEAPRGGGAWRAAVCGVAQSRTRLKRLSSSGSSVLSVFQESWLLLKGTRICHPQIDYVGIRITLSQRQSRRSADRKICFLPHLPKAGRKFEKVSLLLSLPWGTEASHHRGRHSRQLLMTTQKQRQRNLHNRPSFKSSLPTSSPYLASCNLLP